jgi:hypothetical protein
MTVETIQVSLRATKLLVNVAGLFKGTSDPFVVVTIIPDDRQARIPNILGKTET